MDDITAAPSYRKLERTLLAICVAFAPAAIFLSFVFDPTNGVPGDTDNIYTAFRTASPLTLQLFLIFNTVATFLFAPSYIGLGLVPMRRAPWLATMGTICGLIGALPWAIFIVPETIASHAQNYSLTMFTTVWDSGAGWAVTLHQLCWVGGHLLGYLLLGLALLRAKSIPTWAAALLIFSVPLQVIAYPLHAGIYQILGFIMVFIASLPVARRLIHPRADDTTATL